MADSLKNYPPVGDDSRFEAIRSRGRSLKRRRQAVLGSSLGGLVAAAVALVLFVGGNTPTKDKTVFANQPPKTTEAPSTGITKPEALSVTVGQDGSRLRVEVADPAMPVPQDGDVSDTGYRAQQCSLLQVGNSAGDIVAEGFGCSELGTEPAEGEDSQIENIELRTTNGLEVGCAAVEQRTEPVPLTTISRDSTFNAAIPSDLTPGTYKVTVSTASGFGDGCALGVTTDTNSDAAGRLENVATVEGTFTVNP